MRKKFYLPTKEADRRVWLQNFRSKIDATYAASLSLNAGDVTLLDDMTDFYAGLLDLAASIDTFSQNFTSYKNDFCNEAAGTALVALPVTTITPPATTPASGGLWAHVSNMVDAIKSNALYTDAIGQDLGIVGAEVTFDATTFQPVISSVKIQPGPHVILNFKKDVTHGANFYCRINGGTWTKRAYDTNPPYDDYTPLTVAGAAEKREYRARAVMNDVEIGVYSEIVSLTVGE